MLNENLAQPAAGRAPLTPAARLLLGLFERIETGNLTLRFAGGARQRIERGGAETARLHIHRPAMLLARALLRGPVGFAESHIAGDWDSPDLAAGCATARAPTAAAAAAATSAPTTISATSSTGCGSTRR